MTKEAEQRKTAAIYRKAARCGNCLYAAFKQQSFIAIDWLLR